MQESQLSFKIRRTFLIHMIAEKSLKALQLKCSKTRRVGGVFFMLLKTEQNNKTKILTFSESLMKMY